MHLRSITVAALAALVGASAATAHVTPTPSKAAAGSYAVLAFNVGHGCEGSPTRQVSIQIPASVTSAKPRPKAGWTISIERVKLAKPTKDTHGKTVSDRVGVITWSGGRLEDGWFDTFDLSVKLPDGAGKTVYFPVVQRCVKGVTRWIQIPTGSGEPDRPAPGVVLTKATGGHS